MTNFPSSTDLSKAVARTRASYDETPYASAPLARQQPARIAAAALWFGLTTAPVRTARVLEIGCASGGHIIPLAALWPEARFVGVDLSPAQIAAGKARIERLGLGNIALDRHGLAYVGECNVAANREDGMAPAGAATIRALARGDDRAREQYLDIFSGRAFREAVITHATRAAGVSREIRRDRLDAFHFVAPRALKAIPPSAAGENWRIASGDDAIEIDEQAVAGAIKRLIARLPRSSRLEDIAPAAATEPYLRERVG